MSARKRFGWIHLLALVIAAVVAAAVIAQAVREHSLEPIWSVGWLPAVLIATFGSPANGRCMERLPLRRRSRS